jgi:hypothetical protein
VISGAVVMGMLRDVTNVETHAKTMVIDGVATLQGSYKCSSLLRLRCRSPAPILALSKRNRYPEPLAPVRGVGCRDGWRRDKVQVLGVRRGPAGPIRSRGIWKMRP